MGRRSPRHDVAATMAAARAAASAGSFDDALTLALHVLDERPRAFDALMLTAVTLQRTGRNAEAITFYERAIAVDSRSPDVYHNLGCALLASGRLRAGAAALETALTLRAEYAPSLDALAFAVAELGEPERALALFERSLTLDPASPSTHGRLGNLLLRLRRYDEALPRFDAGLERTPDAPELLDGRGVALCRLGREGEAADAHRRALAVQPTYANAASNLGKTLLAAGAVDEAMGWIERAIALEPRNGSFYLPLVTGGSKPIAPPHVAALKQLAAEMESLPHQQQIDLHFALGNVFEREGAGAEAFAHYAAGNRLKRGDVPYDEAAALGNLRAFEAAFAEPNLAALRAGGSDSERPVFIVGMPRSGTTLVEQISQRIRPCPPRARSACSARSCAMRGRRCGRGRSTRAGCAPVRSLSSIWN